MTEQVIDIRDRIEKMRNQMTVPNKQNFVQEKKIDDAKINASLSKEIDSKTSSLDQKKDDFKVANENKKSSENNIDLSNQKIISSKTSQISGEKKNDAQKSIENLKTDKISPHKESTDDITPPQSDFKKYKDYQNDRVKTEGKQSVKFEDKQSFPQFSLNVSNPISWKLMLLIMLMQLLTNMMLVVVLYLK